MTAGMSATARTLFVLALIVGLYGVAGFVVGYWVAS